MYDACKVVGVDVDLDEAAAERKWKSERTESQSQRQRHCVCSLWLASCAVVSVAGCDNKMQTMRPEQASSVTYTGTSI